MSAAPLTDEQRHARCDGYHDRMRGILRTTAAGLTRHRSHWLDGWDSADGVLYDRAITSARRKP